MDAKFKSRKFLTMLIGNLVGIIFAALALYLTPDSYDAVERMANVLTPLLLNVAVSLGYLSQEGKADALGILQKITQDQVAGQIAATTETVKEQIGEVTKTTTRPVAAAPKAIGDFAGKL